MKWTIRILTVLLGICVVSVTQDNRNATCPTVVVNGPTGIVPLGQLATYRVVVENGERLDLKYIWTVSQGTIESGQGTAAISVRQPNDWYCPTATVEVIGLPRECPAIASETTSCDRAPQAEKIDELFGPVNSIGKDAFRRIADVARNDPSSQIYIFVGTDPVSFLSAGRQVAAELAEFQVEGSRITFVDRASSKTFIQVWRVPPGAAPPTCEQCDPQWKWQESQTRATAKTCSKASIDGPRQATMPGGLMTFKATISGKVPRNIRYEWQVNTGTIVGGQGTRILKVKAPRDEGISTVRAFLKVVGLPRGCDDSASEVAGIAIQPVIDPYDRYGDVTLSVEKERLSNAAWAQKHTHRGYKILLIKRLPKTNRESALRIQEIKIFLRVQLGLSTNQYQIVTKTGPTVDTTIWFVRPTTDINALVGDR